MRNQKGFVLVAALLFAMTLSAFVASIIGSGVALRQQNRYQSATQVAQQAAESGIHLAVGRLSGSGRAEFMAAGGAQGVLRGDGERAPRYRVTVRPAGNDGADNDQDGQVDEADEQDMLELTSRGDFDGVGRTVRVTLLARYQTPELPSATYFADPFADLDFNGNAFLVSGYDVDLAGNPTGQVAPGIGVNGSPASLIDQIRRQQQGNVVGSGGSPSVVNVESLDMQALIEEGARSANVTLEGGSGTVRPPTEGAWGTLDAPAIVYGRGDIHVSGGAEGAGILIVNGTLTISGAFEWRGLIVVMGKVVFKGGGGGKRLIGSLVVEKDVLLDGGGGLAGDSWTRDTGLAMNGTVDVILSEATIRRMSAVFATYTVLNWREGPNPPEEALP